MQMTTLKVMNRKIDSDIIAQLDTATNDTGTSQKADVELVSKSLAILGNAEVDIEDVDNMFGVVTPSFWAYLMQTREFASGEYVEVRPFNGPMRRYFRWFNINWVVHPNLTGVGTSTEKCYIFHRNAIGHAVNTGGMMARIGYDDEQDYSYARCSMFMGSKLLQQAGIVQVKHDGSAYVAA